MSNAAVTTPAARLAAIQRDGSVKPLSLAEAVEQLFALVGDANALNAVLDAAEKHAARAAERLKLRSVGGAYVPAEPEEDATEARPKARCQGMTLSRKRCRCTSKLTDGVCGKHTRFAARPAFPSDPTCEVPINYAETPTKEPPKPRPQRKRRPAKKRASAAPHEALSSRPPIELYVKTHTGTFRRASAADLKRALAALERANRPAA
jgi:hypothetical protein